MSGAWYVTDLPLCVLLGMSIGALLSFSTAAATVIARVKRHVLAPREGTREKAASRVSEVVAAVFPVVLVSVLAFVLPLLFSCRVRQDHVKGQPGASHITGEQHQVDHRMFVRFTCQQGQYNDMASLLLPSLSGSFSSTLSHLYSRDSDEGTYSDAALVTLAVCYYFFPLFIIGCSFPFGLFVPNLVFGSAAGHLFGRLANRSAWVGTSRVAHPTVYAVLGAGAALGGWTRMAIAISAIMLEQTGNMDSVILMMVTVLSSRMVAGMLAPQSFTDEVIKQKGYQVLEPREPHHVSTHRGRRVHPRRRRAPSGRGRRVHRSRADAHLAHLVSRVLARATLRVARRTRVARAHGRSRGGAGTPRSGVAFDPPRHLTGDGPRAKTGRARIGAPSRPGVRARRSRESRAARRDGRRRRPRNGSRARARVARVPHVRADGGARVLVVESGGGNRLAGVVTRGDLIEAEEKRGRDRPRRRRRDGEWSGGLLRDERRPRDLWAASRSLPATRTNEQ